MRDDATPIALQPFLQRASAITLTVGGGSLAASTTPAIPLGDLARGARRGRAAAAAEVYLAPWLALVGGAGYRFAAWTNAPAGGRRDLASYRAGAALRLGDLRLAAGLDGATVFDDATTTYLRGFVEVRAVLLEHIDVAAAAGFRAGSGDAVLHVDYYPSRALGLLAGVFGGRNADPFPDAGAEAALAGHDPIGARGDHLGFLVGFSYWASPSLGVSATWAPAWITDGAAGASDQRVLLTLGGRAF